MKNRMLALLAVLCCVALVAALFVACNNGEEGQTDNTGATTPADDDAQQGGETPDDEGQGGETPDDDEQNGDTQDPADPDEGNEGEEDPDEDIEEPETPDEDEGGEENPPIEDEKDPFVIDTLDELFEYKSKTTYDFFYDNYMQSVVTALAGRSATLNNAEQIEWEITVTEGETITEFQVRFVYHKNASYMYYVGTVVPTEVITVNDILTGNTQEISRRNILPVYSANTIEADMEQNRPLAEAIVTELGGTLNDSDQLLFAMDTATTDPEYSWVRYIRVKQITDKGVNEYKITINAANATGEIILEQLQKNLEAGQYKNALVDENVVTFGEGVVIDGTQADVEVPKFEEQ